MYPGIQSSMRENRMRSYALIVLFPILLFVFVNIILSIMFWSDNSAGLTFTQSWNSASWSSLEIFTILGPIILIRGLISFFYFVANNFFSRNSSLICFKLALQRICKYLMVKGVASNNCFTFCPPLKGYF